MKETLKNNIFLIAAILKKPQYLDLFNRFKIAYCM